MQVSLCNVSPVSKRIKYIPPPSNEFTVTKVIYPLGKGQIAPGMSVIFVVHFHATNLSDFDDELIIVTDVGAFPVNNTILPILNHCLDSSKGKKTPPRDYTAPRAKMSKLLAWGSI